jgi:Raf kinase inhibitor-like YbhB/YbcL family protein
MAVVLARGWPLAALAIGLCVTPGAMLAQETLDVRIEGLVGEALPDEAAFCIPDAAAHQAPGPNIQPSISWSAGPEGTQSYAILLVDSDVPTEFENFNKEGATLAADMPRQNFYHWVLVDIPAGTNQLDAGVDSEGKSPKPIGKTAIGLRGVNDYTKFMTGEMAGDYGGYDGPCPPWNDERMHHYTFRVYALDVASLGLSGPFTGPEAESAMEGHVLAQGEATGTYTLNPAMR